MPNKDPYSHPFFSPPPDVEQPSAPLGAGRPDDSGKQSFFAPPSTSTEKAASAVEGAVTDYLRPTTTIKKHPAEYYKNIPAEEVFKLAQKSAPESAKGVVRKAIEGLGDLPQAAMGLGSLAESGLYNIPYVGESLASSKEELAQKRQPLRQLPGALYEAGSEALKSAKEAYGSPEARKKTLSEDPFKVPADIASTLMLTGTGLRGAGKLVPGKIGETVGGLGAGLQKTGEWTNPITAPIKGAEFVAGSVAPELINHFLHGTSGLSKESLDEFMKAGLKGDPTVSRVMKGEITPEMTIQSVSDAIANKKLQRESNYLSGMNQAQQNTILNAPIPYTNIDKAVADAYSAYTSGPLQFAKNKDALDAIQKAENLVGQWKAASQQHPYYSTAKGIDDLKQAIDGIMDEHPSNAAKKALGSIRNSAKDSIASLDKGYAETLDHYSSESTAINRLAQGLQRGDPNINIGGNIRNLIRSSKDQYRRGLIEDLLEHDPTLLSQIAAHELHGAPPFDIKKALGTAAVAGLASTAAPNFPLLAYATGLGAAAIPFTSQPAAAYTAKKLGQIGRIAAPVSRALPTLAAGSYLFGGNQPEPEFVGEGVLNKSNFFAPPGQAYGGRAPRASGGRIGMTAERLLSMLEGAKKSVQKDTESLLQEPDEKIAKALTIAKEGI